MRKNGSRREKLCKLNSGRHCNGPRQNKRSTPTTDACQHQLRVGDQVMLDARNLRTTRPNASLDFKNRGSFRIVKVVDNHNAYQLDLPPSMSRVHDVFHP